MAIRGSTALESGFTTSFPYVLEGEYTVEEVVPLIYPDISEEDVLAALRYYLDHHDEIEGIRERIREVAEEHRSEALTGPE